MPIKILHFADLHIGMENYGRLDPQLGVSSRIRDFLDRLDEVVHYAFDHDADLVVFAGDAFKTRDPDPTQQREFAKRIKQLADKIPVFMLVGNHDVPGMAQKATSVDIFRALDVPNVIIGYEDDSRVIHTKSGDVFLAWVPFPIRNRLLAQEDHRGASIDQLDSKLQEIITTIMRDLATEAAEQKMPRVLVGHFSVGGATFGSERSVMLGRDLVVSKSSLIDPVWDYVCFAPSQTIVMADGSVKRIDQIHQGDQVTNHLGESDKVIQITSRKYSGLLYQISAYYLPSPTLLATPDHPILVVRREQLLCPLPSRNARSLICAPNNARLSYPCRECAIPDMPPQPQPEYISAAELRVGDFLCVPISKQMTEPLSLGLADFSRHLKTESCNGRIRIKVKGQGWDESVPSEIIIDENFARLCGYFLAEGSLMTSKRHTNAGIQFTFGSHETTYHQDVITLVRQLFKKNYTLTHNKYGQSITICVSSRLIGETFQQLFRSNGAGCKATHLPNFMTRLPSSLEREVLIGAIRGDGHFAERDKNRRRGLITYATISETLAWQLWRLALRQGLAPSLRLNARHSNKNPNSIFTLDFYGMDARALDTEIFGKKLDAPQKTKQLCFRDENFLFVPIRAIETSHYAGDVMNLEVENSHTYIAGGVAVHNCLGHIHKHQNLNDSPPVVYSGSLERIDFGEEVEDKGFCWIELARGKTKWDFIKVKARSFVTIKVDIRDSGNAVSAVQAKIKARDLNGAIARVTVKLHAHQEASLRERDIEKLLREAGVYTIAAITKDVEREVRTPLGASSPETLSPAQLVEKYFLSKDKPMDEVTKYVKAAESLFGLE